VNLQQQSTALKNQVFNVWQAQRDTAPGIDTKVKMQLISRFVGPPSSPVVMRMLNRTVPFGVSLPQ
jgi:hypothetical protein